MNALDPSWCPSPRLVLLSSTFIHGALYLVVKNFGATAARRLRVTFDPPFPEIAQGGNNQPVRDSSAVTIRERYRASIQVLAPGQNLVNVWTNRAQEDSENHERKSLEKRRDRAIQEGKDAPKVPLRLAEPVTPMNCR